MLKIVVVYLLTFKAEAVTDNNSSCLVNSLILIEKGRRFIRSR